MSYKGIDISSVQANDIDFNKMKANNVEIVYVKITEGLTYENPYFKSQCDSAHNAGMLVGAYHYLRNNDAIAEAKHFLSAISGMKFECKYCIDAEVFPVGISARTRQFADYLISQGKEPCLYTGLNFYQTEILDNCKDIPLWVAAYRSTRPDIKSVGWQYTDANGLDLDVFDEGILLSGVTQNIVLTAQPSPSQPIKPTPQPSNINPIILSIQQKLNRLHIGVKLVEDGISGGKTTLAIRTFQTICGIGIDGIWGNQSNNCYQQIISKPLCGLNYIQRVPTRYIQWRLGIKIDGVFGNDTASKMEQYQASYNLYKIQVDGVVGNQVWAIYIS